MKIIYGVAGEGLGHAFRSKLVIEYLLSKKHDVKVIASNRAYTFLHEEFGDIVQEVEGLYIKYRNNKVCNIETGLMNIKNIFSLNKSRKKVKNLFLDFEPNYVICDFEIFTSIFSRKLNIPLISVDNQHMITNTKINFKKRDFLWWFNSWTIVKSYRIKAIKYLVTTFFNAPIKKNNTVLVSPIIRKEIYEMKPKKGDFILVYQTSKSYKKLIKILASTGLKFHVYGVDEVDTEPDIVFRERNNWFEDLANCNFVIANGGFGLMGESLLLKKPILSVPVKKQFEQLLNATYLDDNEYGKRVNNLTKDNILEFNSNVEKYRSKLLEIKFDKNAKLFFELDKALK